MAKSGLTITTKWSEFQQIMNQAGGEVLNAKIRSVIPQLKMKISDEIKRLLWESDLVQELNNPYSKLVGILGTDRPTERINEIIDGVADSLEILLHDYRSGAKRNIVGYLTIRAIKKDYSQILNLPASTITDKTITEYNWLEWILLYGNLPIVIDHMILGSPPVNNISSYSRTNLAITKAALGRNVYVPAEFQGDASNNFITRALIPHIYQSIQDIVIPAIKG